MSISLDLEQDRCAFRPDLGSNWFLQRLFLFLGVKKKVWGLEPVIKNKRLTALWSAVEFRKVIAI